MSHFPMVEHEAIVQVGDRTRISADQSFSATGEIIVLTIDPEGSGSVLDIMSVEGRYSDWIYSTAGTYNISVSMMVQGSFLTYTKTSTITVIDEDTDALLNTDQDLKVHESNIFEFLKDGRASFKDVIRRAKKMIIDQISLENIKNGTGNSITIDQIYDTDALKDWSTYLTLRLIFFDNITSVDDRNQMKVDYYKSYEDQAKLRALASVKFDEDLDGESDGELPDSFGSIKLVRR